MSNVGKVLGLGGVFFKSNDGAKLAQWYKETLGFAIDESYGGCIFPHSAAPKSAYGNWAPFKADTDYFAPSTSEFMINFMVNDVKACLQQVADNGGQIAGEIMEEEFGIFGWFIDPDGHKVELWQLPAE